MDCKSASAAERVCDCGEDVQCPNERKPIFFIWTQPTDVSDLSQQDTRCWIGRNGAATGWRWTSGFQITQSALWQPSWVDSGRSVLGVISRAPSDPCGFRLEVSP